MVTLRINRMRDQCGGGSLSHKHSGGLCNKHSGSLHHQQDGQELDQTKLYSALSMSSQSIPKSTKRQGPSSSSWSRMCYSFIGWGQPSSIAVTGRFWGFGMLRLGEFFQVLQVVASTKWVASFQSPCSLYPFSYPVFPPLHPSSLFLSTFNLHLFFTSVATAWLAGSQLM